MTILEQQTLKTSRLAEELANVAEKLRCSTVQIRDDTGIAGSGTIWSSDGTIISNAHVVKATRAKVELSDRRVLEGKAIALDSQRDLAVLKVNAANLSAANVGNTDKLRVGELVLAVGNPFGDKGVVTTGIIHTIDPRFHWVQADIKLAPGNSGGPLANVWGQVIGINTAIVNGRGFAIPTHAVNQFLKSIKERKEKPYLGVTLQPVLVTVSGKPLFGLQIVRIESGSPANIARLQPGDVLIGIKGKTFQTPDELFHVLDRSNSGDWLQLDFLRSGKRMVANIVLCNKISATQLI